MSGETENGVPPKGSVRLNPASRKIKPDTENLRIWAEVWHKVIDRVFSQAFFAFVLVVVVVWFGMQYAMGLKDFKDALEVFKLLLPVVTLYLGFAIGKGMGSDD